MSLQRPPMCAMTMTARRAGRAQLLRRADRRRDRIAEIERRHVRRHRHVRRVGRRQTDDADLHAVRLDDRVALRPRRRFAGRLLRQVRGEERELRRFRVLLQRAERILARRARDGIGTDRDRNRTRDCRPPPRRSRGRCTLSPPARLRRNSTPASPETDRPSRRRSRVP